MGTYSWLETDAEVDDIFLSIIYSTNVDVDDLV